MPPIQPAQKIKYMEGYIDALQKILENVEGAKERITLERDLLKIGVERIATGEGEPQQIALNTLKEIG